MAKRKRLDIRWTSPIPLGSHGSKSCSLQKKYWKVVSDFVRIRDFYEFGTCIACGKRVNSWKDLQAGHYKSWASCNGFSKWDMNNIFGECAYCNTGFNGNEVGANFKDGILGRYGADRIEYIQNLNKHPIEKITDEFRLIEGIKKTLEMMKDLPEKPDYYEKVIEKMND